jgi:cytochrome P450
MLTDSDLMPFEPPAKPLGLRGLVTLWRNYVETFPRAAYEQGVTRMTSRLKDTLLVCDPELIGTILVDKADAFTRDDATRRAFAPVIGANSLFLAHGADWRWQRRTVAPIFRYETLLSFVPMIAAAAERQVERWRATPPGVPVDASAGVTRTTFAIIVETMLGGSESLDAERYGRALTETFDTIPWHIIYDLFGFPEWMPYPHQRGARQAREFLRRDVGRIVAARLAKPSTPSDLLDLLLKARDPESGRSMTHEDVVSNLLTFITAGHETTAVALSWTLWLLAKDQGAQQRVHEEVVDIAGHAPITAAQVEGLSFARQVIQEAMRLFPPAAGLGRVPKAPMQIDGLAVTPRTRVHIPTFALHRNIRLWDHPHAFDPERFAPERVQGRSRYAFLPFGAGPRVCIGAAFAMIEAAVILATLVRAFRFLPVAGHVPRPVARVTLRPAGGMPILIEPR